MSDSVYKIITLVGTSTESWEKAAATAVERATKNLRGLRIASVKILKTGTTAVGITIILELKVFRIFQL